MSRNVKLEHLNPEILVSITHNIIWKLLSYRSHSCKQSIFSRIHTKLLLEFLLCVYLDI